ncbi:hypothetical protein DID74_01100 [Candidatus Marinamargulisbacteria bacterium SCGC AG-333-B06]|nr:hypothetical protein DID74_01100 [Candidatus Marinamargulisbacteria bacterium SCGC AG-333-B06]
MKSKKPLLLYLHGFLGHHNELAFLMGNHGLYDVYGIPWGAFLKDSEYGSCVDIAIAINQYLDKKGIQGTYLYGYSMGGRIAMQLIALYPDKWQGLIIESAHSGFENGLERRDKQRLWEKNFKQLTEVDTEYFLLKWYEQPLFYRSKMMLTKQAWKRKKEFNIEQIKNWGLALQTTSQINMLPYLQAWHKPILYIAGEDDEKYSKLGKKIASIVKSCKTVIIQQADHNVHVCKPCEVKKILAMAIGHQLGYFTK